MQRLTNWLERRRSASRGRRAIKNNNNLNKNNKLLNNKSFDDNFYCDRHFPRGAPVYASMTVVGCCAARPCASFGAASLARGPVDPITHFSSASSSSTTISGVSSLSPWRDKAGHPATLRYNGESSCRMKIRTNPWLHNNNNKNNKSTNNNRLNQNINCNATKTTLDRNAGDLYRMKASFSSGAPSTFSSTASFGQPTTISHMLHSSTCSSGYGSQDNSPDCSVHSPDWTADVGPAGGMSSRRLSAFGGVTITLAGCASPILSTQQMDEHIYHELESSNYRTRPTDGGTLTRNTHVQPYRIHICNEKDEYFVENLDDDEEEEPLYAVPYRNLAVGRSNYDEIDVRQVELIDGDLNEDGAIEVDVEKLSLASTSSSASTSCESWTPMMRTSARPNHPCQPTWLLGSQAYWQSHDAENPSSSDSSEDEANMDENQATRLMLAAAAATRQRRHLPATPPSHQQLGDSAKMSCSAAECNVLAELDQQIVELQLQSDAVCNLVDAAKARHELRARICRPCTQHLQELRCCVLHNHFELCI